MRRTWATALCVAAMLVISQVPAWPQALTSICVTSTSSQGANNCVPVSSTNPLPTTGGGGGGGGSGGAITGPLGPSTAAASSVATTFGSGTTLPAFAATPTFNLGNAIPAGANTIGSIANSAFGISGTLPAFASTPTFNLGTLNGAATAANQTNVQSAAGTQASTLFGIQGGGSSALPVLVQLQSGSAVSVSNFPATQTISGTVTANQGGAPWSFNQTQLAGTALGAPTAYGTAPSGNVPGVNANVTNFPATQTVSGTVTNNPSTGATLTTSQPSVTTTAATLTFSGTVHREIMNPAANTASIFIGASGVTTTTGFEIPPGASYDISRFSGSVFAVAASLQTVRLISY